MGPFRLATGGEPVTPAGWECSPPADVGGNASRPPLALWVWVMTWLVHSSPIDWGLRVPTVEGGIVMVTGWESKAR